jgi:hypothetical protein
MKNTFYCQYCLTHKDLVDYSQEYQNPNLKIKICNQCHAEGRNTAEYKAAQNLARIEKQKKRYREDPEFRARQNKTTSAWRKERLAKDPEFRKQSSRHSVASQRKKAKAAFEKSPTTYCNYCNEHLPKLHFTEDQLVYGAIPRICIDCSLDEKGREEAKARTKAKYQAKQQRRCSVPQEYGGGKERDLQKYIQDRIGGGLEVQNDAGVIDILTPTRLIEIKTFHGWKECLGQLNAYQFAHLMDLHNLHLHKPTAVLFWECTPGVPTDLMFATFKHFNIDVFTTWSKDQHCLQNLLNECPNPPTHPLLT